MDFLDRLLPQSGFYCTAKLNPGGGFIHYFFTSLADVKANLAGMDAQGHTMYLAQASFSADSYHNWSDNKALPKGAAKELRKRERTQTLAMLARSFWVDIDCGEEKFARTPHLAYPSQMDAAKDLRRVCSEIGMPHPCLVNSGHGLYAHWILDQDITIAKWNALASILKKVLTVHKFKQDPSRTSDCASVLRPVGTHNRKTGEIKEVTLISDNPEIPLHQFVAILDAAAAKARIATPALQVPTQFKGINDEFTAGIGGPPSSAIKIATKCAQIRELRDTKGQVAEPVWYAAIGLLHHCEEGEGLIHEWSQGHPDYSPETTDAKIAQHKSTGAGPTTCAKFGADNPTGCLACPHANKIKSPIVLGRPELVPVAVATEEEVRALPFGFKRTDDGLFYEEEDSAPVRFYPYDLYLTKLSFDGSLGYETVTVRHQLPVTLEYKEFAIRSALLHDQKQMLMALADHHVHVSGKEQRQIMGNYIDRYMADLRRQRELATLHSQMGWAEANEGAVFVLGQQIFRAGEEEETAGFARNIPEVAKGFCSKGDLAGWKEATKYFGLPGMEPLAFAFLAGAFGAPLMRFTGYAGAMVALVGRSGLGKTLVGEMILSVYGDPRRLSILKNDTTNALVSRLGLYGSLPLYLDEVSNIEGQELSDLLYRVTQGRDKARLHRSGQERGILNSWNTLAVASSNHSLTDKLSNLKSDASAEINRILEIHCRRVAAFGREQATAAYRAFHANYGTAGPTYVKYLVDNQEAHKEKIDALSSKIDLMSGAAADERFWSAMSAVAIYGGLIAKKLGLIDFEVVPIMTWLVERIKALQEDKQELVATQTDILGQFLDDTAASVLITSGDSDKPGHVCSVLRETRGALSARIKLDQGLLYISRAALKRYLEKTYGSYSELKEELESVGALLESNGRKILGAGTYVGGTQQPVWVIDLNCPALGRTTLRVVKKLHADEPVAARG